MSDNGGNRIRVILRWIQVTDIHEAPASLWVGVWPWRPGQDRPGQSRLGQGRLWSNQLPLSPQPSPPSGPSPLPEALAMARSPAFLDPGSKRPAAK